MADVVLARPTMGSPAESRWSGSGALGLAYLAATLRANHLKVEILDGKLQRWNSPDHHADAIARMQPRCVGISAMTVEYGSARQLARKISERWPSVTVLGGAHANALPADTIAESTEFDFLIAGEAELSLLDLVRAGNTDPGSLPIPGLWFRGKSGEARTNAPPRFDTQLESLPFPAWDLLPRMPEYPVMWERGCPYACVFCSRNLGQRVRTRPWTHMVEEILWIVQTFSPKVITFQDETFGIHLEPTLLLLERLAAIHSRYGTRFRAQTRVDRVTDGLAERMRRAGFASLELGVESGSPEVLARSGKRISLPQVERSVQTAKKHKLRVCLKFILGLPGESEESMHETVKLASRLRPHRISASLIVAYPGSEVYQWAKLGQMGYRLFDTNWDKFDKYLSPSVELENLPYAVLRRWQLRMYLTVYLRGFRLLELMKLAWLSRSVVYQVLAQATGIQKRVRNGSLDQPMRARGADLPPALRDTMPTKAKTG